VARIHVLCQQCGQLPLFAPQRTEAQQQQNSHEDEGGKAEEKADFDRTHDGDFTREGMKKTRREAGFSLSQPRREAEFL
jgi:hypothetical protein